MATTLKNHLSAAIFINGSTIILRFPKKKLSEILSPMTCALARMINCQIESDTSQLSQIIVRPSEFNSVRKIKRNIMSHVTCHASLVTCHASHVICWLSHGTCLMSHVAHVTFPLSPTLTETATDPPLGNFPTMHSWAVCKDPKNTFC